MECAIGNAPNSEAMADVEETPITQLPQLPREVWSSIICQHIHSAGLRAALQLRCVNSTFDEEVICALFILRVKNLRRSIKRLHIPNRIAFLQLQGFFAQKNVPRKEHKVARRGMLRAGGHDPHRPISNTCFSYRPGQPCQSIADCKAHDIINALICAQDSHVFVWGTDKEYRDDIFGVTDPRIWELLVATYKNNHDCVRHILGQMLAEEPANNGVRFFNRCMLIATRTNNPSMILRFKTELDGRSINNEYYRRRLGEPSALHNCLNESIRLKNLDVFDSLLQWDWKFANSEWSLHNYLKFILEAKNFERAQREEFFSTLLKRTEDWRDLSNMTALLMVIGESDDQRAFEILLEVLRTKASRHQVEGNYHILAQPLVALTQKGNLEMARLYLENRAILFPTIIPECERYMRQEVVAQELKSAFPQTPNTPIVKLIMQHSNDMVEEKRKLMEILIQPEVQKQKLETWAWLALKLDLKSTYYSSPPSSFGSILLRDAVSSLNVETVRFLVNNGVWLESDASTSQVYEDDEEMMGRLNTVQTLLARAGQGQFTERKTVETTFSCTVDRAPKPNKKTTVPKKTLRRVYGSGIARGVRSVIGTAELEFRNGLPTEDSETMCNGKGIGPKVNIWPKTYGRSYAAVAAALTAKVTGGTASQKSSISSGSSNTASVGLSQPSLGDS